MKIHIPLFHNLSASGKTTVCAKWYLRLSYKDAYRFGASLEKFNSLARHVHHSSSKRQQI